MASPNEADSNLAVTGLVSLFADPTEIVTSKCLSRDPESRRVGEVEEFRAQLKLHAFSKAKDLKDRQIQTVYAVATNV
jgi:hypothetical protein